MTGRAAWAIAALLAIACGEPQPRPIAFGETACAHCHMTATDPRFAAELVTQRHKVFVFDDAGCLAAFLAEGSVPADQVHSLWVTDYLDPDRLLRIEQAVFLRSAALRTPMDTRVVALRPGVRADSMRAATGGEVVAWADVVAAAGGHGAP